MSKKLQLSAPGYGLSRFKAMSLSEKIGQLALEVAHTMTLPPNWPQEGAVPSKSIRRHLRDAGWPLVTKKVPIPQHEHHGLRKGQQTTTVLQEVTMVPESWLRELTKKLGFKFGLICKSLV